MCEICSLEKKKNAAERTSPSGPFKEAFKVLAETLGALSRPLRPPTPQSTLKNSPEKKLHVGILCSFPAQERSGSGVETGRPMSSPLLSVNKFLGRCSLKRYLSLCQTSTVGRLLFSTQRRSPWGGMIVLEPPEQYAASGATPRSLQDVCPPSNAI